MSGAEVKYDVQAFDEARLAELGRFVLTRESTAGPLQTLARVLVEEYLATHTSASSASSASSPSPEGGPPSGEPSTSPSGEGGT